MDDLLLWRWSTTVQVSSSVILAVFMTAFGRLTERDDTRWWMYAFQANLLAIMVTSVYWIGQPEGWPVPLARMIYVASKTLFVLGLLAGVLSFLRSPWAAWLTPVRVIAAAGALGFFSSVFLKEVAWVGVTQSSIIALVLGSAAVACFGRGRDALHWLGLGLFARVVLGVLAGLGYGFSAVASDSSLMPTVSLWLASHSSLDTGAEWLIVLGCVVAVARRSEAELQRANRALVDAVQRDPLTGLGNRRALGPLLDVAARPGAALFFFDLDDFKAINDAHGHDVGDASLKRFSLALRDRFPDADGLIRYAGDEFVVLLPAMDERVVSARIEGLRAQLGRPDGALPPLYFSVGEHRFGAEGMQADDALRIADKAMYRNKAERRRAPRS